MTHPIYVCCIDRTKTSLQEACLPFFDKQAPQKKTTFFWLQENDQHVMKTLSTQNDLLK